MIKNWMHIAVTIWSFVGIALFCSNSFSHLIWKGFIEHAGEVNFSSVSWLFYNGHPLYTTIDSPYLYNLQHGPIVYIINGGVMNLLGPDFFTAKLASFLATIAIVIVSFLWFAHFFTKKTAFVLLGLETWLLTKWYQVYLVRADVLMVLCLVVSLYFATTKKNRLPIIFGVAIPLGILVNLKLPGILYALPVLMLVYEKLGWRSLFLAGGTVGCIAALPFLIPNISFINYIQWLRESIIHGISYRNLLGNWSMAVLLLSIPIAISLHYGRIPPKFFRQHRPFLTATLITLLLSSIIGGKYGSGSYHLMPVIPIIMCIVIQLILFMNKSTGYLHNPARYRRLGYLLSICIFVAVTFNAIHAQGRIIRHTNSPYALSQDMLTDFYALQTKYYGSTMMVGYGDTQSHKLYDQLMPLLVFSGNPYLLDLSTISDMKCSSLPIPTSTVSKLARGEISIWLIPADNAPFSLPLFDDAFRQTFLNNYRQIGKTKHFDIWQYKGDKPIFPTPSASAK